MGSIAKMANLRILPRVMAVQLTFAAAVLQRFDDERRRARCPWKERNLLGSMKATCRNWQLFAFNKLIVTPASKKTSSIRGDMLHLVGCS